MGMMSGWPTVTAVLEASGKSFNSCQQLIRSGTPCFPRGAVDNSSTKEMEDIKTWTAMQKPSPSVIKRMDIGNHIPS